MPGFKVMLSISPPPTLIESELGRWNRLQMAYFIDGGDHFGDITL
jgi:hypothetical protein